MLEFQLTPEDYVEANSLHMRWTRGRWIWIGAVLGLWLALVGFEWWSNPEHGAPDPLFFGIFLPVMALFFVALRYWFVPRQARRIFAQTRALQRPFHWTWNEEQLQLSTDLVKAVVPWTHLLKWRESEQIFIVYPSVAAFYVFPKRAFQDRAAIDAFRQLLQEKIAAKPKPEAAF